MTTPLKVALCLVAAASPAAGQVIVTPHDAPARRDYSTTSALVWADAASCAAADRLTVAKLTRTTGANSRTGVARGGVTGACHWRIDDLPAGAYEVDLAGANGSQGAATFEVLPDRIAEVHIPHPTVGLTGRVLANGAPVIGARISFAPTHASLPSAITRSDGSFDATLAAPGNYSLMISADSVLAQSTEVKVVRGQNAFDWDIRGGTITVTVEGWDGRQDAIIHFDSPDSSFRRMRWDAGAPPSKVFRGVPDGSYMISVESSGRRSQGVTVVVDRENQSVEVKLRLGGE